MKTGARPGRNLGDVQPDQSSDVPRHESFVRHPIRATVHEAEHAREVANEGASAATPAILALAVLVFIVPLAAILMLLAFGAAHFR